MLVNFTNYWPIYIEIMKKYEFFLAGNNSILSMHAMLHAFEIIIFDQGFQGQSNHENLSNKVQLFIISVY